MVLLAEPAGLATLFSFRLLNVTPSLARMACRPVNSCHRSMMTSTKTGTYSSRRAQSQKQSSPTLNLPMDQTANCMLRKEFKEPQECRTSVFTIYGIPMPLFSLRQALRSSSLAKRGGTQPRSYRTATSA